MVKKIPCFITLQPGITSGLPLLQGKSLNIINKIRAIPSVAAAGVIIGRIDNRVVARAVSQGADIIEVRLDTFDDLSPVKVERALKHLREITSVPILLTLRSRREGGTAEISDKERLNIITEAIRYADIVDIELGARSILKNVIDLAHKTGKPAVVSYHNFKATPGTKVLVDIISKARSTGADLVKIAAFANKKEDIKRLARLLTDSNDLIMIAMGPIGVASRVFFPILGSRITYGSVTGKTAPGQISLKEIKKEFLRYGI